MRNIGAAGGAVGAAAAEGLKGLKAPPPLASRGDAAGAGTLLRRVTGSAPVGQVQGDKSSPSALMARTKAGAFLGRIVAVFLLRVGLFLRLAIAPEPALVAVFEHER